MGRTGWVMALCLTLGSVAADKPLATLDFVKGWCWTAPGEGRQVETHCYTPLYEGRFLRDEVTVTEDDRVVYRGESVYRQDPEGQLRWVYFGQSGGWMDGTAELDESRLIFPPADWVGPDGKRLTMRVTWSEMTDESYRSVTELNGPDGWQVISRRTFRRDRRSE